MFVPSPRFLVFFLSACAVGLLLILFYSRYGSFHPCEVVHQEVLREAAASGQSRAATELRWRNAEPGIGIFGCAGALLSGEPMRILG
jgi:hypothetical protein